ncbi:MAG: Mov34/MPN/PAD-1 family protein [Acidobacteriota bacterium]
MVLASLAALFRPSPELLLALALLEGSLRGPAYKLWESASFGSTPQERAAWVVPDGSEGVRWVNWPSGRRFLTEQWKGPVPAGVVAIVHTHPAMVDPKPSAQDVETARRLGVPVYTISRSAIWKAEPNGSIVSVDGERWWIACGTGSCDDSRHPASRTAGNSAVPAEQRNLESVSAYP